MKKQIWIPFTLTALMAALNGCGGEVAIFMLILQEVQALLQVPVVLPLLRIVLSLFLIIQ